MSSKEIIRATSVSKTYQIFKTPIDRLLHLLFSRIPWLSHSSNPLFKEFKAVSNITLSINRGEKVGIIGKNGSGKSTLLQLIAGTLTPSSGTIDKTGRIAALLELGSGFNPEFTGRENIIINGSVLGLSPEQIKTRTPSILEFADIGDFIDQPVKTYSSGMYVRLAFAIIAHVDADVLIIDEALAVGDTFFNQKCMRFMHQFAETGTIVLVTHDTSAVTSFCTRAVYMEKGEIIADGNTKEVCERYLASVYGLADDRSEGNTAPAPSSTLDTTEEVDFEDFRIPYVSNTLLQNRLEVFKFNNDSSGFGEGGIKFDNVSLLNQHSDLVNWTTGGEIVTLKITATTQRRIARVIVGFVVKNSFGQTLFGENTSLYVDQCMLEVGESIDAHFTFRMPIMPAGDYVISIAVADGTQNAHSMIKWLHDALSFRSNASSLSTGLMGIPMKSITLQKSSDSNVALH